MLHLALCLVHNKTALENRQQVATLRSLLTLVGEETDPETGDPAGRRWYTMTGIVPFHEIRVYQVVPFGVSRPNNMDTLMSHNVLYGAGDNDKTGQHPRFFNWALKRATDYGAGVVCGIHDHLLFTVADLNTQLARMEADRDLVFLEPLWGRMGRLRLLREIGQLQEDLAFELALGEYRSRITARGMRHG